MIYMTTDEWKKISKIVEEKDLKELVIELSAQTYDLNVSDLELDHIMMDYIANAKDNAKNNEENKL